RGSRWSRTAPTWPSTRPTRAGRRGLGERRRWLSCGVRLELLHVDGLGPLLPGLLVVGDLGALGQRAIAVSDDRAVVDEEVARTLVGRDEPEPLLVAEPLHGSRGHSSRFLR